MVVFFIRVFFFSLSTLLSLATNIWLRSTHTHTHTQRQIQEGLFSEADFLLLLIGLGCGFLGIGLFGGLLFGFFNLIVSVSQTYIGCSIYFHCRYSVSKMPREFLPARLEKAWRIFVSQHVSFSPTNSVPFSFLGLKWVCFCTTTSSCAASGEELFPEFLHLRWSSEDAPRWPK